ncbi:calcium/proton exchanger [Sistotremastrum niveocremeum HHB9708]|uniref:Vacuolar calcium ion transporter n=2 Tax=Sistotremastraceae TaxID=3402574 RepID=A0A164QWP5_9AGAM|nr:calcium/proton exchanger [Sistotremastrum niveocremeum HHB9708]KZT39270.1 calcium/proton exchanger [Sistotremastrum suecicum HHB10207 ss-3]
MTQPSNEQTPLLNGDSDRDDVPGYQTKVRNALIRVLKQEPGVLASYRFFILSSWFNVFLVFVPLGAVAHFLNWDAGLRFLLNFLAILPLAALLGVSTDELSVHLGQSLAGLLNATFGNAVEIIVGIAALLRDELRIVQTSLLGSILSNILLVLGCSFLAGLLMLAVITLVIPAAYEAVGGDETPPHDGLLIISRGTSLLLLVVYIVFLIFQIVTNPKLFEAKYVDPEDPERVIPEPPKEEAKMNLLSASSSLLLVTVITALSADWLVASIEEVAEQYHIPMAFIGTILLPIVANAAEHVTSVWMAMKQKTSLTISICVGSSIQIATFVIPLLVVIGWITGHNLTLYFAHFETIILFVSVLLVTLLLADGKSNYMEGTM